MATTNKFGEFPRTGKPTEERVNILTTALDQGTGASLVVAHPDVFGRTDVDLDPTCVDFVSRGGNLMTAAGYIGLAGPEHTEA